MSQADNEIDIRQQLEAMADEWGWIINLDAVSASMAENGDVNAIRSMMRMAFAQGAYMMRFGWDAFRPQ